MSEDRCPTPDFVGDRGGEQDHSCHAECECQAGYGNHVSGPTPEKLRGPAGDTSVMASYDDVVSPGDPENKLAITADLIDRAVDKALGEINPNVKLRHVEEVIESVAPLLIEAGAAQERKRWVARIEREAELFDARAALSEQGMEEPLPSSDVARLLRYLLDEEREATNAGSLIERGRQAATWEAVTGNE